MIKLEVKRVSSGPLDPIEVDVKGIREERKFILNPKPRPSKRIVYWMFSVCTCMPRLCATTVTCLFGHACMQE